MNAGAPIRREFIDWSKPALREVVTWLRSRYGVGSTLDLGAVLVVVPGQRAGRRLVELLALLAEDQQLLLTPPRIVTQGALPELLYTPKLPFASDLVQEVVWAKALRELPEPKRSHVIANPPAEARRWLELGKVLRRLHVETAADGLNFEAIARSVPRSAGSPEQDRWKALVAVQGRYHELLHEQKLWDKQTARLKAVELRETRTDADIVLVGTVDLNNTLRSMLDQVAERVTALVVAPKSLAERFDEHGCLQSEAWLDVPIKINEEQLQQVDGPIEQAEAVTDWLAGLDGKYPREDVIIGVADEALVPQLQRQLGQLGVRSRWVEGVRLAETAPYRLLECASRFAGGRAYEDLASLVRHPDLAKWFASSAKIPLVGQLDAFYNDCLPGRVRKVPVNEEKWPLLPRALERINHWLKSAEQAKSLQAWGEVFRKMLDAVYGDVVLDLNDANDSILHESLNTLLSGCDALGEIPPALDHETLSAADAFAIAFVSVGEEYLPPPKDQEALEILGWLELPLDDAPALVVTSFNEGFVPKAAASDPFLPDNLRRELRIMHNDRRYARDAYATSVLVNSRENVRLIFARRDTQEDPLRPSRLLFSDEEVAVRRAQKYFGKSETKRAPRLPLLAAGRPVLPKPRFDPPDPDLSDFKLERISVTHFKTYLTCPYRYYLRHVKHLKAVDDASREMEGNVFGSMIHNVLGIFSRDESGPRHSNNPRQIFDYLTAQLHMEAKRFDVRRPALRLQFRNAEDRLRVFSERQAAEIRAGWRIVHAETDEQLSWPLEAPGGSIPVYGKIDRIDFHEARKILRIIDYKTADKPETPEKAHRENDEWVDLQLPMYRHLWQATPLISLKPRVLQLAYFNLPCKPQECGIQESGWDEPTLLGADDKARQVIHKIRSKKFKMAKQPPKFPDEFSAICLDNIRRVPEVEEEGQTDEA